MVDSLTRMFHLYSSRQQNFNQPTKHVKFTKKFQISSHFCTVCQGIYHHYCIHVYSYTNYFELVQITICNHSAITMSRECHRNVLPLTPFFMFNKVHTINLHPQLNYKALHMIKIQIISPTTLIKFYLFKRVQVNSYAVQITSLTGRFTKLITTFKADALSVSHIQKVLLPQLLPFTC